MRGFVLFFCIFFLALCLLTSVAALTGNNPKISPKLEAMSNDLSGDEEQQIELTVLMDPQDTMISTPGTQTKWGVLQTVSIPKNNLKSFLENPHLLYAQEKLPAPSAYNNDSRLITGVETIQADPYNLSGLGVQIAQWDQGHADNTHGDFAGRIVFGDVTSIDSHATHVAGTMLSDGTLSSGTYRGMAPNATLVSYLWWFDYNELLDKYNSSLNVYNATISQNSWGLGSMNDSECVYYLGGYFLENQLLDDIVRGAEGKYMVLVWSAGNERLNNPSYCGRLGMTYNTTQTFSSSKNIITVGGVDKQENMYSGSSWGPTQDGRIKPDLVAPGVNIKSTIPGNTYGFGTGTSMASPAVSGIVALMIEKMRNKYPAYNDSSRLAILPSTIKAILLQTAEDLGNTGPDYQFGFGFVNATAAITLINNDSTNARRFLELNYSGGVNYTQLFDVINQTTLKITLVWDDYPGAALAAKELVNDFDLTLIAPNGSTYYPWILDSFNPSNPATTGPDHINNVEQIVVDNPENGTWKFVVAFTNISELPQPYSIASSVNLQDLLPPEITLYSPANASAFNHTDQSFKFSATDNMDSMLNCFLNINNQINYSLANLSTAVNYTINATILDGIWNWSINCTDQSGNKNQSFTYPLTIDTIAPNTTVSSFAATNLLNDGRLFLTWTTDDATYTHKLYKSNHSITSLSNATLIGNFNASITNYTDNATLDGKTHINYSYAIVSIDAVGNINTSIFATINETGANDSVPPKVTAQVNATNETNGAVFLNWSSVLYDVDGNLDNQSITYIIYRTTNLSALNETKRQNLSFQFANTTALNYTDITITKSTTYYYILGTLDDGNNLNASNLTTNTVRITTLSICSNAFTAWSGCSNGRKTRTRTCYGWGYEGDIETEISTLDCTTAQPTNTGSSKSSAPSIPSLPSPPTSNTTNTTANKNNISNSTHEKNMSSALYQIKFIGPFNANVVATEIAAVSKKLDEKIYKAYNITLNNTNKANLSIKIEKQWFIKNTLDTKSLLIYFPNQNKTAPFIITEDNASFFIKLPISQSGILTITAKLDAKRSVNANASISPRAYNATNATITSQDRTSGTIIAIMALVFILILTGFYFFKRKTATSEYNNKQK